MEHWDKKDIAYLREGYASGESPGKIAFALNRSAPSVRVKAHRLGLTRHNQHWPLGIIQRCLALINENHGRPMIVHSIMREFDVDHRTASAVFRNANKRIPKSS